MDMWFETWFEGLTQRERKDLVCILFQIRNKAENYPGNEQLQELIELIDKRYHELK